MNFLSLHVDEVEEIFSRILIGEKEREREREREKKREKESVYFAVTEGECHYHLLSRISGHVYKLIAELYHFRN